MSKSNNLLEIWDTYKNSVLLEKKTPAVGKKAGTGAKELNDKANQKFQHKDSGPEHADGVKSLKELNKDNKKENVKFSLSDEKIDEGIEKITSEKINNYMKSIFDKLFEDVMNDQELQDAEALGVDVADDSSAESSDEGTVTVTLTQDQVALLKDILSQVEGDTVSDLEDAGEDLEDAGEDLEDPMKEGVDAEEIGHAIKDEEKLNKGLTKVKSNEVGNLKVVKGKADAKVTDKVGNDGTLADSKGEALIKPSSHKVAASKIKAGNSAFE